MDNPKASPPRGGHAEATNLADKRQKSEHNKIIWMTDLFERVVQPACGTDIFLKTFVPSGIDTPKGKPIGKCPDKKFVGQVPTGEGKEPQMYGPLIKGLDSLVRRFDKNHQPKFLDHANKVLKPPFALCDDTEHETKPDIVVTVPKLPQLPPLERWRNVGLVFEVKAKAVDDPMGRYTMEHETTLIQLAKSARNIMLAQGRLFAFCVGIYGHMARIFRFDRAGAVCSPLFDYINEPQHLHEFLWRFVHPIDEHRAVVGEDPTTSLGSSRDRGNVRRISKQHDPSYQHTPEHQKAIRRFTVKNERGEEKKYLAYKLIFVNTRLCSRASMLWEAFELDDEDEATGVRVVIKEAWRQFERPSELRHYQDLQQAAAEETAEDMAAFLAGFAELERGDDLGLRETRELARAGHAMASSKKLEATGSVDDMDEHELTQLTFPPEFVSGHRTVSACCRGSRPGFERGQIRLVMKTMGTPITDFKSTYEMASGICDAVKAHQRAYEAGIIHRDVSQGNIMLARQADGSVRGFLHDFDHASSWRRFLASVNQSDQSLAAWEAYALEEYKRYMDERNRTERKNFKSRFVFFKRNANTGVDSPGPAPKEKPSVQRGPPPTPAGPADANAPRTPGVSKDAPHPPEKPKAQQLEEIKQRTGTIYFMAIEILDKCYKGVHEARHDLESVYWLLVWIVLRHVKCESYRNWHRLFDRPDTEDALTAKKEWLTGNVQRITIPGNQPLEDLLEELRLLFQMNVSMAEPEQRITHAMVLQLFSAYLEDRSLWPEADCAIRWVMPATRPGDHPLPDGRPRTVGTLAFSLTTLERETAQLSVAPDDVLHVPSEAEDAAPDAGDSQDEEQTESNTDTDIEEEPVKKGKDSVRKTVAQRPRARRDPVAHPTSVTMSQASGSHEVPPSSDDASAPQGSRIPRLRYTTKRKELPRTRPARGAQRSMDPPPAPARRSMDPPPVPARRSTVPPPAAVTRSMEPPAPVMRSRSQSTRHAATSQGSRASKRSRSREDEVVEDDRRRAGTSHSPKRQRTFSQSEPESPKGSRKVKGKKRS